MKTAVEWFAKELYEKFEMKGDGRVYNDLLEKAKEMEKKQKGYTKTDVEYMLYKCCDDLENKKRAFWDIDGLVNEIISTFKPE
jgi:hypothetical protein